MTAALIVGIMEAAHKVGGDSTAVLLFQVTALGGKVIFGTVIIVVGIFLARVLSTLVGSSTGESSYAETIVKYAIIALFTAIGLTFMGLADQIVMMAFGLILGSAAVACAIAFGLGGRDVAARVLEDLFQLPVEKSPRASHRFAVSHQAVMRDGRSDVPAYVFLDAGPQVTSHWHSGKLGFHLWFWDKPMVVDSGISNYDDPLKRSWYIQAEAHNTLLVVEHGQES